MRQVLVVDDEPYIRTALRGYLEAEGFAVPAAIDGVGYKFAGCPSS